MLNNPKPELWVSNGFATTSYICKIPGYITFDFFSEKFMYTPAGIPSVENLTTRSNSDKNLT
jgi:hypothetical protein